MAVNGWQIVFLALSVMFAALGFKTLRDWAGVPADVARYFAAALVAMLFVALTACSTPAVKDRIVEVDKPVAVQPIKPSDVPALPAPLPSPRPSSLSADADILLSRWCEAVAYMLKADPLLRVSAGMPQKALEQYKECEAR